MFYIPIIISCFYYKKRGFVFSIILACIYFLLVVVFTKESLIILQAVIRVFIFILVAGVITYLSSLRQQVKELRITSVYNRSLIEASLDPLLVIRADGKIMDVNAATEAATGYHRTELVGTEFSNYFTEHERARAIFQDVFRGYSLRNEQLEIRHRNGHVTLVLYNASLYQDEKGQVVGVFAAARDITERERALQALQASEEKYRSIVENAQEGIFQSTTEGRHLSLNPAFANMLGYDSPEEVMATITDIAQQLYVNPDDRKKLIEMVNENGSVTDFETEFYKKDGSRIWVSINMHAVRDDQGRLLYYQGIDQNITEKKKIEAERQENIERLRKSLAATIHAMAVTVETRDPYTAGHQRRVADLTRAIATEMNLTSDQIDGVRMASNIHDIGKMSIPSEILTKPTKLTDLEFNLIKMHPQSGYNILKDIEFPCPVADIVLQHHERMDGSGYPQGIKGDAILLEARILAIADVVEAMASHRPYRQALGIEAALKEIEKNKGILYDNAVADACLRLFRRKDYQLQVA